MENSDLVFQCWTRMTHMDGLIVAFASEEAFHAVYEAENVFIVRRYTLADGVNTNTFVPVSDTAFRMALGELCSMVDLSLLPHRLTDSCVSTARTHEQVMKRLSQQGMDVDLGAMWGHPLLPFTHVLPF